MDIGKNYNYLKQWHYLAAEKKVIDRTNNEGNVSNPEVVLVVLVQCNSVDNRISKRVNYYYYTLLHQITKLLGSTFNK